MLKSMTGFGLSKIDNPGKTIHIEIRSLNSKFLDLSIRSFPLSSLQELWVRNECTQRIQRGKVSVNISQEEKESENSKAKFSTLDLALLKHYMDTLRPLAEDLRQNTDRLLSDCLPLPGVVKNTELVPEEETWILIQKGILEAMANFNQFRDREGKTIEDELKVRVGIILQALKIVEESGPGRINIIKTRLENSLLEFKSSLEFDQNRFEQELIYYIDKIDFSEEISRLHSHSQFFLDCIQDPESNGKKLGFISQEMGREINTLGSKAADAFIQQKVVQMKDELEKIKEQLANIL
jgi:uncharacterized protein (TIGR00255 family)